MQRLLQQELSSALVSVRLYQARRLGTKVDGHNYEIKKNNVYEISPSLVMNPTSFHQLILPLEIAIILNMSKSTMTGGFKETFLGARGFYMCCVPNDDNIQS